MKKSVRLYKSLTPAQFAAVIRSGWREFYIESPEQTVFYPKLYREYAEMIARTFNLAHYQAAYVVEFSVRADFLVNFEIKSVAYEEHKEYKIPVDQLPLLNRNLIGLIEVVSAFTTIDCHTKPPIEQLSAYH